MKKKYLPLLLIGMMLVSTAFAAESISVNFTYIGSDASGAGWGTHDTIGRSSLSVAGYAVTDNWNEVWKGTNTTVVPNLTDNNGNVTAAVLSLNNDVNYGSYNNVSSGPGAGIELNRNAVRLGNSDIKHRSSSDEKELLRVDEIPYERYILVAYLFRHSGSATAKITVNSKTYYYTAESGAALEQSFADGVEPWKVATGTTDGDYSQVANVAIFSGLSDPNVSITFKAVSANTGVSAIQIIEWDPADWPTPYRGQDMIEVTSDLSWKKPVRFDPVGYDVYLGTDEALVITGDASVRIAQGHPTTSITPGDMTPGVPYFWRVDAIDSNSVTYEGYILDFETKPATPLVQAGPDSITIDDGTSTDLTISGLNFGSFQWYHSTDASNATPGDDSPVGTDSITLAVTGSLATEGWYYCVVTNATGSDTSPVARVMIKRLVGLWKLDGNMLDSVATEVPGALAHDGTTTNTDPVFVDGKDAGAVSLLVSEDPNDVIVITDSEDYFDFYPQGLTMSVWINTNDDGYGAFVNKQDRDGGFKGVILGHYNNNSSFSVRQQTGASNDIVNIRDGQWHLLTGTLDPDAGIAKFYVDGKRYPGDEVDWNPAAMTLHDDPLIFGAETMDGATAPADALIDDVRIYNYALDPVTIAHMYIALNPGATVCIDDISAEDGDLNGDCEVNLADFAMFAADWMNCLIVPDCF